MNTKKVGNAFYERGSWYHRIKILNDDYTTTYSKKGGFKTPEEAEESFKKYNEEYLKKSSIQQLNIDKEIKLSDYLVYWYENIFRERDPENTYALGVAYAIYNMIVPLLKQDESNIDIKLRLVSSTYLNNLLEELAKISPSSGNKCREVLATAFKDAVEKQYIVGNPIEGTQEYTRPKPQIKLLTKKQIKKLLLFAQYDIWYLEILLGLFCGLRKGEIMGLKFDDFDMNNNILKIRRQLVTDTVLAQRQDVNKVKVDNYILVEKPPKKDSYRNLRVPDVVMQEVRKRKLEYELYRDNKPNFLDLNYISFNKNTGNVHSPKAFNAYLYRQCPRINIPTISIHGLRHMFATILIEKGVPIIKIASLLGHASPNTTFEIYCGIMDEREKILAFINNTFTPDLVKEGV